MFASPARTATRRKPTAHVVGVVVALAAIVAAFGYHSFDSSPAARTTPPSPTTEPPLFTSRIAAASDERRRAPRGLIGQDDGAIPEGTTIFDRQVAGVANLDRALGDALRRAAGDAALAGVDFVVASGWRSAAYQERLVREAVAKYGSAEEAAKWVAPADRSAHVSGDAVDIGSSDAIEWLSRNGSAYGLCQVYANEPWHFELRPQAVEDGCPARYADATHDPRMRR